MSNQQRRIFLLGAGASVEAGIPASVAMTRRMVEHVQQQMGDREPIQLLNYVCGRLVAHDSAKGLSPFDGLDVERLLAAIRLLARRADLEITAFVAAWDPAIDVFARSGDHFHHGAKALIDALLQERRGFREQEVEEALTRMVHKILRLGDPIAYSRLFNQLVGVLRDLLRFEESAADYLSPIIELCRRQGGMTVLTLNYDLTIETVAARADEPCSTGFDAWARTGQLSFDSDLQLLKLHGSVDWRQDPALHPTNIRPGSFPRASYETVPNPHDDGRQPLVVFGAGEKLRADGPFLDLFMAAKRALADAHELVVVGYSFRDDHVNHIIGEWLSASESHHLTVISPSFLKDRRWGDDDESPFVMTLALSLIDNFPEERRRFHDRMTPIRKLASEGLADLLSLSAEPSASAEC